MDKKASLLIEKISQNKNMTSMIIAIVVLLLLACVLFDIAAGIGLYAYYQSLDDPIEAIQAHLKAVNEGRVKDAYEGYTSAQFKKTTSFKNFNNLVESNPQIFNSKSSSFKRQSTKDSRVIVVGTIVGQDGTKTPMTYTMVCANNRWLILGFRQGSSE